MSAAAALNDMKCWAAAMLVFAILSFNLAIFITGIVGCSLVLCCASSNEQVARNASCFKGCAIACAVLGGLHTLLFLVLGFVFVGVQADCTDKLKGNSCDHLTDARRRQLRKDEEEVKAAPVDAGRDHAYLGAVVKHAPFLPWLIKHAPLLLATVTGGLPSARNATSIGHPDVWSKSRDSPPSLAGSASRIKPPIAAPAASRRLLVSYSEGQCRANRYSYEDTDCCWSDHDEPFRCDPGYRPELTGDDCHWWYGDGGSGEKMKCVKDRSYTTVARCEEHVTEFCRERNGFPIAFFFILMVWELSGCIIYSVAACKAANVSPATHTSGTQMQTPHAAAVAVPMAGSVAYATAVAQPVPAVPTAQGSVVPPPLPLEGVAVGSPMPQAQAVDKMGNPIYSGG
jgi:hypothetical protein